MIHGYSLKAVGEAMAVEISAGNKPSLKKIMQSLGYPPEMLTPGQLKMVKKQMDYKAGAEPYLKRLEKHREDILGAMETKDLKEEQYRTLVEAQSKVTHDVQLLSGGKTENVGVEEDRKSLKAVIAAIQLEE